MSDVTVTIFGRTKSMSAERIQEARNTLSLLWCDAGLSEAEREVLAHAQTILRDLSR